MKIAIIGATGMLGNSIYKTLKDRCELVITARSQEKFDELEKVHGGTDKHKKVIFDVNRLNIPCEGLVDDLGLKFDDVDLVINCIGVLNKFKDGMTPTTREYYRINTELPICLSHRWGPKLIHPSTDCVFDGSGAKPYTESSEPCPSYGTYGYAKLFADEVVKERSLVLRCCLIGEELSEDSFQMFSWFKRQETAGGYTNWVITPITGVEFANVCWRILEEKIQLSTNLLHLATAAVSKYQILHAYKKIHSIQTELTENPDIVVNKSLSTDYPEDLAKLRISPFDQMMREL